MTGFGLRRSSAGRLAGGLALALALGAPGMLAMAQDGAAPPHPIHVHAGTCLELGDIVAPLGDVAPISEGEVQGAGSAVPVEQSQTEIPLPLEEVLAAPHAINVHESAERIDEYIACGDIGGRLDGDALVVGLEEMNGSDFSGVAVLEADGDETEVSVYLFEEGTRAAREQASVAPTEADAAAEETAAAEPTETPEAEPTEELEATEEAAPTAEPTEEAEEAEEAEPTEEPAAAAPDGDEIAAEIRDFAFDPDPITIAVGDTITWTNGDGVPHTATAEDRDILQSGAIASGGSFSQTFAEVGEFPYFCEFHPGMAGTIVVE